MTEDSPMTMAIAAMKEHKDFGNMVKYNLSALLLSVAPGHAGWEDNCAEFVRQGGIGVLKEIIEIHAKKVRACSVSLSHSHSLTHSLFLSLVLPNVLHSTYTRR